MNRNFTSIALKRLGLASVAIPLSSMVNTGYAQFAPEGTIEEIVVTGIRSSLTRALDIKRADSVEPLFIIGQDLNAIRGYVASGCCVEPDGTTAYVDFYNVLDESGDFGGLGIDANGAPLQLETDWGGGPLNAYKTAAEFDANYLAIGLSITENAHPGGLDQIVAGERDAEIRQLAAFAKGVQATVLLRIGYEFDGAWNLGYDNAPRFQAAYRRIVNGIRAEGAANVRFIWQGAASTTDTVLDEGRHDNVLDWYPGDEFVDWLGFSWFMHPEAQAEVDLDFDMPTPRLLGGEILALARELDKPVLIAEAAPQGFDLRDGTTAHHSPIWDGPAGTGTRPVSDEEIWLQWYQPMFDFIAANDDVIKGLAYINVRWDDQDMWDAPYESGYWGDSRIETSELIASRFNSAIRSWRGR